MRRVVTVISSPFAFFFCCKIVCGRNLWKICVSHIKLARALCVAGDLKGKDLNKQHTLTHEIQLNVKTYPIHRTLVLSLIFCLFVVKSSFGILCFLFLSLIFWWLCFPECAQWQMWLNVLYQKLISQAPCSHLAISYSAILLSILIVSLARSLSLNYYIWKVLGCQTEFGNFRS